MPGRFTIISSSFRRSIHKVPLRSHIQSVNAKSIIKINENQFNKVSLYDYHFFEELLPLEPVISYSLSKWLWFNYQLKHFPSFDLNIINVFTDLSQSVEMIHSIMKHFYTTLPRDLFQKINILLIPFYNCGHTKVTYQKVAVKNIPGNVQLLDNMSFCSIFDERPNTDNWESRLRSKLYMQEPTYFLLLNDIFKNSSHDLLRYSKDTDSWKQCFVMENTQGQIHKSFEQDIDFWCAKYIEIAFKENTPNSGEVYIPTQLLQFFHAMKVCFPDFKFLAIDTPQRWKPSLFNILKVSTGQMPIQTSKIVQQMPNSYGRCTFITEFMQLKAVCQKLNPGLIFEVQDLNEFVGDWIDYTKPNPYDTQSLHDPKQQVHLINKSSLAVLHN
ncbi:hypothetical protein KAFR_0H00500 [Kazachstania africana CBS 2517]|uniref:type II protein arginine methyltransferase n=1 Tax=Kazachstania africana (strain ATCC 22294 / BCRC 22015 / CBS 2517 / CECT 1963 / NBRC 1671 / NRRL Y-8276) TaxID=1071382 RepID=H2AYQ3_KAZAF|nr:hypothetical protein KAFR_0H00500 [Kazachstania africana CBS 2517]CCF59459.1 hypothetical protein KAFR_0H00500 [Kazachstania africana CBS 2517]